MTLLPTEPGKVTLDLTKGFILYAVIRVGEQIQEGRKVIFDLATVDSPVTVILGLDEWDNLVMWVTNLKGQEFSSGTVHKQAIFDLPIAVCCQIEPGFVVRDTCILKLTVNMKEATEGKAEGSFGRASAATFSLGSSLASCHSAAFEVSHIAKYDAVHDKYTRARIMHSLNLQYGLW
jgi:hypothetical protein